ncbi:MAG: MMPL family transporter [Chloroflexi bacterium]|nr:MAG: MMPL family transporter [Chloroflexota bacterium]
MFETIARLSIKFRWLVLAAWLVVPLLATRSLPSLSSVTQTNNAQFLSASSPSQRAAALAAPFQGKDVGATAIIVASRSDGPLTPADDAAIGQIERTVATVPAVTFVREQGTSQDGQARKVLVATTISTLNEVKTAEIVNTIRNDFAAAQAPQGLSFHLTGAMGQSTDAHAASTSSSSNLQRLVLLFVIVLLFIVFRSVLAPLVTLLPAVASLVLAGPLIAQASMAGLSVSPVTQQLLAVLLVGAGTDYGLFLVFRTREELRQGAAPREAVVRAMSRVGQSITFSAATVIAALLCLLLATFGLYRGIGPSLAIGLVIMLLAALTLLPALLVIFGRAVFWPSHPAPGQRATGLWGRIAGRVVRHPVPTLLLGVVLFGALAAGLIGYRISGIAGSASTPGTDSAAGTDVIAAHFPAASNNPDSLILRFTTPIWDHAADLVRAQERLAASPELHALTGPLDPNGTTLSADQLAQLHASLGPPAALPATTPAGSTVPPRLYDAYRATAQFISGDGGTVQFYALASAGPAGSSAALDSIPAMRAALASAARDAGAQDSGIAGQDAVTYDIGHTATSDLQGIVPVVLAIIALLLALLLRSLVAPWYLIVTVGLSYLAALGFAMIVFVHLGGDSGLNFVIPFLLFIFAMALGEDYNILLMSRIREEAHSHSSLRDAVIRAIERTGGTITSAGLILAGTFTVLGLVSNNPQARQLGFTIAFAVFLDTFFVRTLLVPSIAVLLGRWNWWPSALSRSPADRT